MESSINNHLPIARPLRPLSREGRNLLHRGKSSIDENSIVQAAELVKLPLDVDVELVEVRYVVLRGRAVSCILIMRIIDIVNEKMANGFDRHVLLLAAIEIHEIQCADVAR